MPLRPSANIHSESEGTLPRPRHTFLPSTSQMAEKAALLHSQKVSMALSHQSSKADWVRAEERCHIMSKLFAQVQQEAQWERPPTSLLRTIKQSQEEGDSMLGSPCLR